MNRDHRPMLEQGLVLDNRAVDERFIRLVEVDQPGLYDAEADAVSLQRQSRVAGLQKMHRGIGGARHTCPSASFDSSACLRDTDGMLMQMSDVLALTQGAHMGNQLGDRAGMTQQAMGDGRSNAVALRQIGAEEGRRSHRPKR